MAITQRQKLEQERDYLIGLLQSYHTPNRGQIASELRVIAERIAALDAGTDWTQSPGETLQNIVAADLAASHKQIK